jgi:hypothetical protein
MPCWKIPDHARYSSAFGAWFLVQPQQGQEGVGVGLICSIRGCGAHALEVGRSLFHKFLSNGISLRDADGVAVCRLRRSFLIDREFGMVVQRVCENGHGSNRTHWPQYFHRPRSTPRIGELLKPSLFLPTVSELAGRVRQRFCAPFASSRIRHGENGLLFDVGTESKHLCFSTVLQRQEKSASQAVTGAMCLA